MHSDSETCLGLCSCCVMAFAEAKKRRFEDDDKVEVQNQDFNLGDFEFKRILRSDSDRKSIFLLGSLKSKSGEAILTLEKKAFSETDLNDSGYFSEENIVKQHFHNDIYRNFDCFPKPSVNGVKLSLIHPATEKHIAKFSVKSLHLVLETPEIYNSITKPFIEKEQFDLSWVDNILNGKKEADRVIFNDPDPNIGFVLLPDLKWDGVSLETLYLCAITRLKVLSLRELTQEHLPLLRHIKQKGEESIVQKYNLPSDKLRIFVHYQPSYYHLHIHFTSLEYKAPGINTEKSHLLDTIINNIEMFGDYYQRCTLPCVLGEDDKLYCLIREAKVK